MDSRFAEINLVENGKTAKLLGFIIKICDICIYIVCCMVILDNYTQNGHNLNPALLWEYDLHNFDWQASRTLVVQRVIELGTPEDYYAAFDIYGGIDGFREAIKNIPYLSPMDINFVCLAFKLKKEELRCYKHRPLSRGHWNF